MGRSAITFLLLAALACAAGSPVDADLRKLILAGKFRDAETVARKYLAECEARSDPAETAHALDLLLEVLYNSQEDAPAEARLLGQRAVELKTKVYGPDHPELALTLRLYSSQLRKAADYAAARPLLERSLAIQEKNPSKDPRELPNTYNSMGVLLTYMGDLQGGKANYQRAVSLDEAAFGPDSREVAVAYANLAGVLHNLDDYAGAKAGYERALAIYEKLSGPQSPRIAAVLNNLGSLLTRMGKPADARPLLERALGICEKTYGPNHHRTGQVLTVLARATWLSGDAAAAGPLFARSQEILERTSNGGNPDLDFLLATYAKYLVHTGHPAQAIELALRRQQLGRDHLELTARSMSEREALLYARLLGSALDPAFESVLDAPPEAQRRIFDALIHSRAIVFDELVSRRRALAGSQDPALAFLWEDVETARIRLSKAVTGGGANLIQMRAEKDRAERALAEKSLPFRRQFTGRNAGLPEIAAVLGPADALVSFVRYGTEPRYLAFVLSGGSGRLDVVTIGAAAQLDREVSALRNRVIQEASAPGQAPKYSEASYRRAGKALRQRIWDPLLPHLGGARRVFIVSDGALHLINFAALPVNETGYLIEHGPLIHYLSAERDLAAPPPSASNRGLLALGSPAFDATPARETIASLTRGSPRCASFQLMHFDPLPGSAREVSNIAGIWDRSAAGGGVVELTGSQAAGDEFRRSAPGRRVLHLATHGFFLNGKCSAAAIEAEDPLLLSGLALAGGVMTAEEIAGMNLEGVEWAVLSACDTGLGHIEAGEGVFGLRRAFQLAGARTVIVSLWQVDDSSTRRWMAELYRRRFTSRMGTAESVRGASLSLLHARRTAHLSTHPLYWGGFVAAGDWR